MTEPTDLMAPSESRRLYLAQSQRLADVPPGAQWFANLDSVQTERVPNRPARLYGVHRHCSA